MATPTPGEYQRDVGSGEQMPAGEATADNESLVQGDMVERAIDETDIVQEPVPEPEYVTSQKPEYKPHGGMEEVLFGDPRPEEIGPPKLSERPVPNSIVRALPMLSAIVQDPTTPPAIKAAYNLIIRRMEAEAEKRNR